MRDRKISLKPLSTEEALKKAMKGYKRKGENKQTKVKKSK